MTNENNNQTPEDQIEIAEDVDPMTAMQAQLKQLQADMVRLAQAARSDIGRLKAKLRTETEPALEGARVSNELAKTLSRKVLQQQFEDIDDDELDNAADAMAGLDPSKAAVILNLLGKTPKSRAPKETETQPAKPRVVRRPAGQGPAQLSHQTLSQKQFLSLSREQQKAVLDAMTPEEAAQLLQRKR